MSDDKNANHDLRPVTFWQLHKNPILLRYMRSRLRWNGLAAPLILTLIISIFTYVISYNMAVRFDSTTVESYRTAFLPLFIIQVVIMMFLGTGAVTGGITQEYEDGMVDYHRLTPMSPMAKIVGYLFGLPIREWFLLLVTSFIMGMVVHKGKIPLEAVWRVYLVFFVSIALYHLMALVVVHSMKKKRVAGRVIQLLVIVLYFVFPLLSQFGLVFFEYLTVRPILKENMLEYIPKGLNMRWLLDVDNTQTSVPFFDRQLNAWSFSMIIMSSLTVSFLIMLRRRWKNATSHLMSKPFALVFFGLLMFFLIGNTMPIAQKGEMSITQNFTEIREKSLEQRIEKYQAKDQESIRLALEDKLKQYREKNDKRNTKITDAPVAQTVFGTICVLFACLTVYTVTPRNDKYLLGLRRARNLKKKWIPFHWDEAPGLRVAICVIAMLVVSLYYFSTTLYQAATMPDKIKALIPFIPMVCAFAALVVLVFYLVYEAWENKGLFMLLLFVWVLPIMVTLVIAVQSSHPPTLVWVSSISPVMAYGYGMTAWAQAPVREAFFCSFLLQFIIGTWAAFAFFQKKMRGRKTMLENTID